MPRGTVRTALAIGAVALSLTGAARGQTAEQDSVANRPRPDFDPIGIELDELLGVIGLVSDRTIEQKSSPLSSFVVYPRFGISGAYDSNIYLSSQNEVSDKRIVYSPGVSIQSDWSRHSLSFAGNANVARYQERDDENYEDYQLQANAGIDVLDHTTVNFVGGYARRHEERNAEDDPGSGFEPTVYNVLFFDARSEYSADAILLRLIMKYEYKDYQDTPGVAGAPSVDNDASDITQIDVTTRIGYEFTPGTTLFVQPRFEFRMFDQERDDSGLLQDNQAVGALAGFAWDLTGVTFAEFGLGFIRRTYDEPTFETETNLDYSGRLVWNVTDLLTLSGDLSRSTAESRTAGESGVLTSTLSSRVDYEFLDNIVLSGSFSYSESDNQQEDRTDTSYTGRFAINYFVNENWSAKLDLAQSRRNSNIETEEYDNFTATFTLTGKL